MRAELIRKWKPWKQSTGPKTPAGKAKVSRNADKGVTWRMLRELSFTVLIIYSAFRPQHGHRSSAAISAAASSRRSVVMESGTWRCLRRGAAGPEAFG